MAEGKFSHPRPHREEDRQIEQAFRQVTGQAQPKKKPPQELPDLAQLLAEDEPGEESATTDPIPADVSVPQPPADGDWMDRAMDFFQRNRKPVLLVLCAAAAVLVIAIIAAIFAGGSDPYDGKILSGVYLGDISVGGMTKSQATSALKNAAQSYENTDMAVTIADKTLRLAPADTGAQLDTKAAVNAAYDYGRTGTTRQQEEAYAASRTEKHTIGLLPYLQLDTDYIRSTLDAYAQESGSTLTQTTYGLEGVQPQLAADLFDEHAQAQTLVITMGTPGTGFDANAVYNQVLDAYSLRSFGVTVQTVATEAVPDPIDLDAIYQEFYIAPADATVDMQTYKTIPGSYGCDFDLALARDLVSKAQYGEQVRIPIRYIPPEITGEDALYRDVLGQYQSTHSQGGKNRNTNLRLACEAIDGQIINPGKTFSFNDTLGERTKARGYLYATAYPGPDQEDTLGGGVSQVASALYCAALMSDLEIVSRTPHDAPVGFVPYGLDADVRWRSPDLSFRNSTSFPIKIEASATDNSVTVRILGTVQRDYYIKLEYKITAYQDPELEYVDLEENNAEGYLNGDVIQEGTSGCTVKTYRVKYSSDTNALISRDYEATTTYKPTKQYVARVKPAPTTQPTTVPTTVPPTVPTTEAPATEAATVPTTAPEDQPQASVTGTDGESGEDTP